MILNPCFLLALPIGIGGLYAGEAWKRRRTDNQRTCTSLAALWSIWTIAGLIYAISLIPPPPPPGVPRMIPDLEYMFPNVVYFVFLPALAVWVLMMLDLIIYGFRAASRSKQVEAVHSL